jgi:hypothetical protein
MPAVGPGPSPQVGRIRAHCRGLLRWSGVRQTTLASPSTNKCTLWLEMAPLLCHAGAMDLTPYVTSLRQELALAAETGGPEARALAERLTAPLESALRLTLLEALSTAAGEITRDLAPGSVDLRLRGREPSFVVTPPPAEPPDRSDVPAAVETERPALTAARSGPDADEATMARINLRLPQDLKDRVEHAAREAGLSVNAWLVRSAAHALAAAGPPPRSPQQTTRGSEHYSGWVR